jgi:drug/metabolite transporter (DMT)-like permease
MFFFLAILSMIAYSFQGTLLAHHARKMDGLSLAWYRNLSLWITMLPLLFFSPLADFSLIHHHWMTLVWATSTGSLALALGLQAVKYLPVGISTGLKSASMTIMALVLGIFFFQEHLTGLQIGFIFLLLLASIFLAFQKNTFTHFTPNMPKGLLLCLFSGILTTLSFFFMSKVSRELNPFIAGYIWEFGIGLFAFIFILFRAEFSSYRLEKIPLKEFSKILWISSATLIGTGGFAYAVTIGSFSIASSIGVGGIFVSTLLAFFVYKEKLRPLQWILLFVLLGALTGLKLSGV